MKRTRSSPTIFFIFLFVLIKTTPSVAQCVHYDRVMQEAKDNWKKDNFNMAFAKLATAREVCPEKSKEVDAQYAVFMAELTKRNNQLEQQKKELAAQKTTLENQKTQLETKTKEAIAARDRAKRLARQAKSKELAAKALLEFSKEKDRDETVAVRLAYTALQLDSTVEARAIFEKLINQPNNQYYALRIKGHFEGFNRDSTQFLTYHSDSMWLVDWQCNTYGKAKGFFRGFYRDSTQFLTYHSDSMWLVDWQGNTYGKAIGTTVGFNRDSSRFLEHV